MFKGTLSCLHTLAYVIALSALAIAANDWREGHHHEALVQRREALSITPATVDCRNGWEFFRALANQSIERLQIISNIQLYDADWGTGGPPLVLERNVSIEGANKEREHWFIININFVKSKVQLSYGIWMRFYNLVLVHGATGPVFQHRAEPVMPFRMLPSITRLTRRRSARQPPVAPRAKASLVQQVPGLDMVAATNITNGQKTPAVPGVLLQSVGLFQRTCLPIPESRKLLVNTTRPDMVPGNQSFHLNLPQDGCEDSCTAHPLRRCWPLIGKYDDMATQAYYLDTSSGMPREAGYNIHILGADVLCATVMNEQCISSANSYIGCFYLMFPPNSTATLPGSNFPVPCTAGPPPSQASGSINKALLGAVLGGVLGGIAFLAAASGIAVLAYRCRQPAACGQDEGVTRPRGAVMCVDSVTAMIASGGKMKSIAPRGLHPPRPGRMSCWPSLLFERREGYDEHLYAMMVNC
ncbi:hypothetical protein VOLCADRAFT_105887 [Volvox carteri f. nagariensis]|uniref:Pherophorin domain-containing protein n=1 Tax=Volvox carteri f. nagariensis TaxID=3068 RepID=D8U3W8_VOLCA|nr:uncharacterized protein VOLCADRAFT_105887 [Volvox carteri f. nagariensis]EFJ45603.1 hypothetical protein VOLCADRAFT_105887 [Volvox carteri f. nagariensis]|eukprot:XP_002953293.1 hypothetical protein VOLCADRAFT_105887 [Volvox carteri f. nagariensis]